MLCVVLLFVVVMCVAFGCFKICAFIMRSATFNAFYYVMRFGFCVWHCVCIMLCVACCAASYVFCDVCRVLYFCCVLFLYSM